MNKSDPAKYISWAEAISKYFEKVGLCAEFDLLRATPAIGVKNLALQNVLKKKNRYDMKCNTKCKAQKRLRISSSLMFL